MTAVGTENLALLGGTPVRTQPLPTPPRATGDQALENVRQVLESGLMSPGTVSTGWLNRALTTLEPEASAKPRNAFAVGPIAPLVVRGPAPVLSWTPPRLPPASDDTIMRLLDLYRHTDPALARVPRRTPDRG